MSHNFPKIIWQTHNHKKEWLPEHLRMIASSWINLNPGWEYRYANQVDRDETVRRYPKIYETYKHQLPAVQSDIWRFITLYENGGCYADMDSVPVMNLDYMLDGIYGDYEIVTVPESKGVGNTHNFLSIKGSGILKGVIEDMATWAEDPIKNSKLQPWSLYVDSVYSEENSYKVSKMFQAYHSLDYKTKFPMKKYMINDHGSIVKYEDFIKANGLSAYWS